MGYLFAQVEVSADILGSDSRFLFVIIHLCGGGLPSELYAEGHAGLNSVAPPLL